MVPACVPKLCPGCGYNEALCVTLGQELLFGMVSASAEHTVLLRWFSQVLSCTDTPGSGTSLRSSKEAVRGYDFHPCNVAEIEVEAL